MPIAFQQTNRPVPVVYSLNTEFQLCNNEKVFMMDPATADVSMAEMDYKGAFSMGTYIYIYIYVKVIPRKMSLTTSESVVFVLFYY